jgi:hypothetical protein
VLDAARALAGKQVHGRFFGNGKQYQNELRIDQGAVQGAGGALRCPIIYRCNHNGKWEHPNRSYQLSFCFIGICAKIMS